MTNAFTKQEMVAFDEVFEAFEDQLVMSNLFGKYTLGDTDAERSANTIWRPMPYIAQSFTGVDQTANFNRTYTQLSVPTNLGFSHSVPLTLSPTELRDLLQEKRLGKAAMQRLGSDINVDCNNLAALQGSVVIKRTTAAAGFDDVAACDNAFTRLGINYGDRFAAYGASDYNGMASNLAARATMTGKPTEAYENGYVGTVNGFETYKLDYAYRLTAAAGVTVTISAAAQFYTPVSTVTTAGGQQNVDNRFQTIPIAVTSGTVKVGDAFTIAGVNEVHHITKLDTGSLKTFRIAGIVTGAGGTGTVQITPPIISGGGGTDAELQYKNVTATPGNGAAITFLNTVAANANPFWHGDAFEIMPGRYMPAQDSGLTTTYATTANGVTVSMSRQGNINALNTLYRWDVFYGLVCKQPEMCGIELFSQT